MNRNADLVSKEDTREIIRGVSLETLAVVIAVTGTVISSLPLVISSMIMAGAGTGILSRAISRRRELERKTKEDELAQKSEVEKTKDTDMPDQ